MHWIWPGTCFVWRMRINDHLTMLAVATVLVLLGTVAAPAEPVVIPPPGYSYQAAPCPETGTPARIYRPCEDQMAILAAAREMARSENKLLLVKLGANWCPACRALHLQLAGDGTTNLLASGTELGRSFHVVEIAVSMLSGGKVRPVPSGEAVVKLLAQGQPGFSMRAIPLIAIAEPSKGDKVFFRHVDDLVPRGKSVPDPRQIADMLRAAERHIRHGEPAPAEPGWLWRQARKLLR